MEVAEKILPQTETASVKDGVIEWFAEFIQALSVKKIAYSSQAMTDEESRQYEFFATASEADIINRAREGSDIYFSKKIVVEYLKEIHAIPKRKLAFDLSGSEILVWIETENDNEDIEKQLILAEAKINAEFYRYGYRIDSMIVEESDHLSVPTHYVTFQQNSA